MGKTYPVGIVGEANYQASIRRCGTGQRVHILRQPDNPYDADALAVVTIDGETIGYIARDCWLQGAIHDEGRGCEASIMEISRAGNGNLGVVLEVMLCGRGVGACAYASARVESTIEEKGWLSRLLGL